MINHDDDGQAYEKTTLDNGLRVVTSSMPHTRSVTACVFVGVGSRYEDDERAGLSHFIEHLVFKGTSRRPDPKDISGTVEAVGGEINAGTEHELTTYWSKVPEPHAEETLDLLVDMLRHSLLQAGRRGEGAHGHLRGAAHGGGRPRPPGRRPHRRAPMARPPAGPRDSRDARVGRPDDEGRRPGARGALLHAVEHRRERRRQV